MFDSDLDTGSCWSERVLVSSSEKKKKMRPQPPEEVWEGDTAQVRIHCTGKERSLTSLLPARGDAKALQE